MLIVFSTGMVSSVLDCSRIELGCYDALEQKYLESITLNIFTEGEDQSSLIEMYSISMQYPSSEKHRIVCDARASGSTKEGKAINQSLTLDSASSSSAPFSVQIIKMLRTMCIMMQTLDALPERKCMNMKITYYDELTPPNYQPKGFTTTIFEVGNLFSDQTFKHDFGLISSEHHRVIVALESTADKAKVTKHEESLQDVPALAYDPAPVEIASIAEHTVPIQDEPMQLKEPKKKTKIIETNVACLCGDKDVSTDLKFLRFIDGSRHDSMRQMQELAAYSMCWLLYEQG